MTYNQHQETAMTYNQNQETAMSSQEDCNTRTFKRGDKGPCVYQIQRALIGFGLDVEPDALFGKQTQNAVYVFQGRYNHDPDSTAPIPFNGVVDPKTWHALEPYL